MRSVMLILLPLLVLGACADDALPAAPLGSFVLDAEAMTKALVAQGLSQGSARRKAAAGRVRLVFDPKGTFTLVVRDEAGRAEHSAGRWSRRGDALTLATSERAGKRVEPPTRVEARLDGDRLEVEPGSEGQTPFLLRRE